MLSIIIPTYNEEKYLPYLLDSIFSQSYRNYEIIIIDGNSTDKTKEVVSFVKKRLSSSPYSIPLTFKQVSFRHVARQKNFGASLAKGRFLLFIDADMVIPNPHFLYHMMKLLENKRYVGATCRLKTSNPSLKNRFADFLLNSFISTLNKLGFSVARGGLQFLDAAAFARIHGFNGHSAVAEDIELSRRISRYGRIFYNSHLHVIESDRRYRKHGYLRTVFAWCINGIWCFIFRKSLYKRWDPVR